MSYELRDISGSVVVITGATAGMGAATARELVDLGAKVVLNARNERRLEEIVADLGSGNAEFVAGSLLRSPKIVLEPLMQLLPMLVLECMDQYSTTVTMK